ncbi:hypothetical protein OO013_19950 [Mangrovivirga sp. M17]|uniref:Immunity protein 26 of polymorphic toxin system n=1 Tax=Mangrovivirga halotolerans TaxID=2993936 RepID=A0ABT3RWX0_9BACT|nr:hypothetical protein [Mangrovivirga halotolerans]MCX2746163.1 hypothetical protein [Mangrovivirga halotolerans]
MITNKVINIDDYSLCYNTSEAFTSGLFFSKEDILIPYININISSENPLMLNIGDQIEFSYLILREVKSLQWDGYRDSDVYNKVVGHLVINQNNDELVKEYFALVTSNIWLELKIKYKKCEVFIPRGSRINRTYWSSRDLGLFKRNVDNNRSNDFLQLRNIPPALSSKLKSDELIPIEFTNSEPEIIKEIKKDW